MIVPTPRCILLFVAGFVVSVFPAVLGPRWWPLWVAGLGVSCLATLVDAALGLPRRKFGLEVLVPKLLYIGSSDPMTVTVRTTRWRFGAQLTLRSELSEHLEPQEATVIELPTSGQVAFDVLLKPTRRGLGELEAMWARWSGPLGLVRRAVRVPVQKTTTIVPNTRGVRTLALQLFGNREFLTGLKRQKYIGDGSEFESLREFQRGLDPRAIDWKASARHVKLLSREYRAESNHQVVIVFDTGHLMIEPTGDIPKLDHAVNSALLLGYVALKTGDRVGLFSFADDVGGFTAPRGGLAGFPRLQHFTADLAYSTGETNFTLGFAELLGRMRRRSLIVIYTEFVDTITADLMLRNLRLLTRRHLVLFVAFKDPTLTTLVHQRPGSTVEVNRAVVASDFLQERRSVLQRLRRMGVLVIEANPSELPTALINRYLDVKRRELL